MRFKLDSLQMGRASTNLLFAARAILLRTRPRYAGGKPKKTVVAYLATIGTDGEDRQNVSFHRAFGFRAMDTATIAFRAFGRQLKLANSLRK
jgi:hypothetical protein